MSKLSLTDSCSHTFVTLTFQNDERVLKKAAALFDTMVRAFAPKAEEWKCYTLFQHLAPIFAKHSKERGGNVLALDRFKTNNIRKPTVNPCS